MKWIFVILLALFSYTSAQAREVLSVELCVKSEVDSFLTSRYLPVHQIKVDSNFLICLNRIENGAFYHSLFDVPDDLLQARYEFILSERERKGK